MKQNALTHFIGAGIFALVTLVGYTLWFLAFQGAKEQALRASAEVVRIEEEDSAIADAKETLVALASDEAVLEDTLFLQTALCRFSKNLNVQERCLGARLRWRQLPLPLRRAGV